MSKSIAIYPTKDYLKMIEKWDSYACLGKKYGFDDIFSTLHLPEVELADQLNGLYQLGKIAEKYQMSLTVDIGGKYTSEILNNEELLERIKTIPISYIRLDCNYNYAEVKSLYEKLDIEGFILNASIYDKKRLAKEVSFLQRLDGCKIKACHNFYPREESGLDQNFALLQDEMVHQYIDDICYFICSHTNPRGPIYKGLPTIEKHRYMDPYDITKELITIYHADSIMLSDEFFSEEELKKINQAMMEKENEVINIEVECFNDYYDDIVFKVHSFRYDSNDRFLRSESSRAMSEFAKKIPVGNNTERFAGAVTVDNELYCRYSGELQVVLQDELADERVNVVGKISKTDLEKLKRHRDGYQYRFIRKKNEQ